MFVSGHAKIKNITQLDPFDIGTLVITHANLDHTNGNALLEKAEIISSSAAEEEMKGFSSKQAAQTLLNYRELGEGGKFFYKNFSVFDLKNARGKLPTRTFSGSLSLKVGNKNVHLIEVGPAHTAGDIMVHVPNDKTLYTGDILFINGTPIMWAGPVLNWIKACNMILDMDVDVIVPGHGPITDKNGVRKVQDYLKYIDEQARRCYESGLSVDEAVEKIPLNEYKLWLDSERIVVNVDTLYREYSGDTSPRDTMKLFGMMGAYVKKYKE